MPAGRVSKQEEFFMKSRILTRTYFTLCAAALMIAPVFAYLDPGTVSYVVSMIAALFIAAGAALAIFRRKIKLFFQNLLGKNKGQAPADTAPDVDTADSFNPMDDVVNPMEDAEKPEE